MKQLAIVMAIISSKIGDEKKFDYPFISDAPFSEFGENFISNFHRAELNYMNKDEAAFSVNFGRFVNERNVIGIMDEIAHAQGDIEQNVNAKMVFFDFSLKMIVLLIQ